MKLHDLKPAEGSRKSPYRKGRGIGSGNGKTAGKATKVKTLAPAAVFVLASKAVKTRSIVVCLNVVSTMLSAKSTRLSISKN